MQCRSGACNDTKIETPKSPAAVVVPIYWRLPGVMPAESLGTGGEAVHGAAPVFLAGAYWLTLPRDHYWLQYYLSALLMYILIFQGTAVSGVLACALVVISAIARIVDRCIHSFPTYCIIQFSICVSLR